MDLFIRRQGRCLINNEYRCAKDYGYLKRPSFTPTLTTPDPPRPPSGADLGLMGTQNCCMVEEPSLLGHQTHDRTDSGFRRLCRLQVSEKIVCLNSEWLTPDL
ncbi:hypothetical protein JZ751_009398 [Albula glossodonta]|uniref:Uncharacterized protein n=1 Tax=Albula glossodonta TaxID=121402 RepID=A0A8T2N0I5_9TELE|nr:hypothetical protein JZ751_009398 [Albula glossodonta]